MTMRALRHARCLEPLARDRVLDDLANGEHGRGDRHHRPAGGRPDDDTPHQDRRPDQQRAGHDRYHDADDAHGDGERDEHLDTGHRGRLPIEAADNPPIRANAVTSPCAAGSGRATRLRDRAGALRCRISR